MVQFKIADEKRKYMERLKEIITKNYTSDFPEGTEIENHKEYIKTVRDEEQAKYDSDSDHVIDDETVLIRYITSTSFQQYWVLFSHMFPPKKLLQKKKKNSIFEKFRQEIISGNSEFQTD